MPPTAAKVSSFEAPELAIIPTQNEAMIGRCEPSLVYIAAVNSLTPLIDSVRYANGLSRASDPC